MYNEENYKSHYIIEQQLHSLNIWLKMKILIIVRIYKWFENKFKNVKHLKGIKTRKTCLYCLHCVLVVAQRTGVLHTFYFNSSIYFCRYFDVPQLKNTLIYMYTIRSSLNLRVPLCSTFIVSHTWIELSSLPANKNLPDTDRPHDVKPEVEFGGLYMATCWSDLTSYRRADLSSEAVANP